MSIRVYLRPFMVRIVEGSDLAGGSSNRGGI
jgi:hypothetical protein